MNREQNDRTAPDLGYGLADHLLWQADHPLCKMLVGGLSLGRDLVGGVPQVPTTLSANFGKDWSPRDLKKYKRSAFSIAKSLYRNFNPNYRCVFIVTRQK